MKKLISVIIALLVAMLPLCALAQSPLEQFVSAVKGGKELAADITFTTSDDSKADAALLELISAFSAKLDLRKNAGAFTLLIGGKEATTVKLIRSGASDLIVKSDAIGDFPVLLSAGNAASLAVNGFSKASLEDSLKELSAREAIAKLTENDAGVLSWYDETMSKAVVTQGTFTADAHDDATRQTVVTLDSASLCKLLSTDYVKKSIKENVESGSEAKAAEKLESLKKKLVSTEFIVTISLMTNEKELPVSLTADGSYNAAPGQEKKLRLVKAALDRKTVDGLITLTMSASRADESAPTNYDLLADMTLRETGKNSFDFEGLLEGATRRFTLKGDISREDGAYAGEVTIGYYSDKTKAKPDHEVALSGMGSVTADSLSAVISLGMDGKDVGKANLKGALTEDSGAFKDMEKLTPNDCKKPQSMSKDELSKFKSTVSSNITVFGFKVMTLIPSSSWSLLLDKLSVVADYIN